MVRKYFVSISTGKYVAMCGTDARLRGNVYNDHTINGRKTLLLFILREATKSRQRYVEKRAVPCKLFLFCFRELSSIVRSG